MAKTIAYAQRKWTVYLKDAAQTHVEVMAEDYELLDAGALELYDNHPKHVLVMLFAAGSWSYCRPEPEPVANG
jgi:hypothetical protein